MRAILGIDAGGTFTDCVVIDADSKAVLHKAKTRTTKDDLRRCLEASFAGLPTPLVAGIASVCLSTTLATNAVVEGHGCREGLILIGGKPRGRLPTPAPVLVKGRFDLKGRLVENIEPAEVLAAVESLRPAVDAVAVSGYASIRCPDHELFVKAVVEDRLGVPVVCAHELTSKLGHYERTVTAVLNARLIPMVCDLMDAVKAVMAGHGIEAPLMMVRGDGTLMADGLARARPIETILSGPAASAIGAVHLSGRSDCFVVDIGGTTTDIANVSDGRVEIRSTGARVGDWATHVRAAEVFTVGLGGDSRIQLDGAGRLRIGPERSVGYAVAAARYPHLVAELEEIHAERAHLGFLHPEHEAYAVVRNTDPRAHSSLESAVAEALRGEPHTLFHLNRLLGQPVAPAVVAGLVRSGVVERISLTPTDVWHVGGQYSPGDARAAGLALRITAELLGCGSDELIGRVRGELGAQLDLSAVGAAMYMDHQDAGLDDGPVDYFLSRLLVRRDSLHLRAECELVKPVVGIGAPAATWLGDAVPTSLLRADVPEHAEVANAIGAAIAHVAESIDILIRRDAVTGQFLVFSPQGRHVRPTLDEATQAAICSGEQFLARVTRRADLVVESRVGDVVIDSPGGSRTPFFVERVLSLTARPEPASASR